MSVSGGWGANKSDDERKAIRNPKLSSVIIWKRRDSMLMTVTAVVELREYANTDKDRQILQKNMASKHNIKLWQKAITYIFS